MTPAATVCIACVICLSLVLSLIQRDDLLSPWLFYWCCWMNEKQEKKNKRGEKGAKEDWVDYPYVTQAAVYQSLMSLFYHSAAAEGDVFLLS